MDSKKHTGSNLSLRYPEYTIPEVCYEESCQVAANSGVGCYHLKHQQNGVNVSFRGVKIRHDYLAPSEHSSSDAESSKRWVPSSSLACWFFFQLVSPFCNCRFLSSNKNRQILRKLLYLVLLTACLGLFIRQANQCLTRFVSKETTISLNVQR